MTYMTMEEASRVFRAMNGDEEAQKRTRLDEVIGLKQARTFHRFLRINKIKNPTEVQRV
jgi:hypothetical protein